MHFREKKSGYPDKFLTLVTFTRQFQRSIYIQLKSKKQVFCTCAQFHLNKAAFLQLWAHLIYNNDMTLQRSLELHLCLCFSSFFILFLPFLISNLRFSSQYSSPSRCCYLFFISPVNAQLCNATKKSLIKVIGSSSGKVNRRGVSSPPGGNGNVP